jgi:hypothetical protein
MSNVRKVTIQESDEIESLFDEKYEIIADDNDQDDIDEIEDEEDITSVEDLEDDQEIWSGGPTAGQIKAWKQQYGEVYVTSISFDKHVVWRVLSRLEYKQIVKKMEQMVQSGQLSSAEANMWNEETISELCILFPKLDSKSMNGTMAGLPSLIAQEVLEASGFVALEVRQL